MIALMIPAAITALYAVVDRARGDYGNALVEAVLACLFAICACFWALVDIRNEITRRQR